MAAAEGRLQEVQSLLDGGRYRVNDEDEVCIYVLVGYRMDLNFCGTKLSQFLRFDSHPRKFSPAKYLDQRLLGSE